MVLAQVRDDVPVLPDMVARGDHVDTGVLQLLRASDVDAFAAGGVLSVCHDEIDALVAPELTEQDGHRTAARPPHDVAEERDSHAQCAVSLERVSRITVTLICPGYVISCSMRRAMSRARNIVLSSETEPGSTITR